eukprot:6430474-Pyramimonas_sp.AAC.1
MPPFPPGRQFAELPSPTTRLPSEESIYTLVLFPCASDAVHQFAPLPRSKAHPFRELRVRLPFGRINAFLSLATKMLVGLHLVICPIL